jgi:hypothetical protein
MFLPQIEAGWISLGFYADIVHASGFTFEGGLQQTSELGVSEVDVGGNALRQSTDDRA